MRRLLLVPAALAVLAGCGGTPPAPGGSSSQLTGTGTVNVLYAGSLTNLFEKKLGPAFGAATGFTYQGEGKGSIAIANLIKDRSRTPDVMVSADPAADQMLAGSAGGSYVRWWADFAATELVVAWSPKSRFAADFRAARKGSKSWESVLLERGLRLGRTDPELDPKGYRTLMLLQLDEQRTHDSTLSARVLGAPDNPSQVFPEEQLVARLQTGELDAGFFYKIEATEASLPYLDLPPEVNQGDPRLASDYERATYTTKKGVLIKGSPIEYTVTIPSTVRNREGAIAFIQFLKGAKGRALLNGEGLSAFQPRYEGDPAAVPPELR